MLKGMLASSVHWSDLAIHVSCMLAASNKCSPGLYDFHTSSLPSPLQPPLRSVCQATTAADCKQRVPGCLQGNSQSGKGGFWVADSHARLVLR